MKYRIGDKVEILSGKWQGRVVKVTDIENGRIKVQIPNVEYEMSYVFDDVKLKKKSTLFDALVEDGTLNCSPLEVTGDKKLRLMAHLIKQGKICPSWPYSCSGDCLYSQYDSGTAQGTKKKIQTDTGR